MKLTLFGYWRSSSSWRVRIALYHKGLAFDYVPVHLVKDGGEQKKPDYLAKNPQGVVPLLEIGEGESTRRIAQSLAIIEWLDVTSPVPPLLPRDPYLAARARWLAEIVNSGIQPMHNTAILRRLVDVHADEKAWARGFIERGLLAYQASASETAGRFSVGDSPTIADLCLVPQLYQARRFDADLAPLARLLEIEARCAELPAFQAAHALRQPDAPSHAVDP